MARKDNGDQVDWNHQHEHEHGAGETATHHSHGHRHRVGAELLTAKTARLKRAHPGSSHEDHTHDGGAA